MEIWVDAARFPSYEISTHGRIRNKITKNVLKASPDRYGYLRVSLGNVDNIYIHRLMCLTFYGAPKNGCDQVNHIDCDRSNNHILNLEWCSASDNIRWAIRRGNLDPYKWLNVAKEVNMKPVKIKDLNLEFSSVKECAQYLNVRPTNVSRVLCGSRKGQRLNGHIIEYV